MSIIKKATMSSYQNTNRYHTERGTVNHPVRRSHTLHHGSKTIHRTFREILRMKNARCLYSGRSMLMMRVRSAYAYTAKLSRWGLWRSFREPPSGPLRWHNNWSWSIPLSSLQVASSSSLFVDCWAYTRKYRRYEIFETWARVTTWTDGTKVIALFWFFGVDINLDTLVPAYKFKKSFKLFKKSNEVCKLFSNEMIRRSEKLREFKADTSHPLIMKNHPGHETWSVHSMKCFY